MAILVTGGAGYIGSVTVELLREKGETVVVLDNLSRGHRAAVDDSVRFYQGDVGDRALVERILRENDVESCVHFAAFAYVGESMQNPAIYFENNTAQTINLVGALLAGGVKRIVFSSTCATYGEPVRMLIDETHPQAPTNPYGWSKFVTERMLESYDRAYDLRFVALRYFNAAGATATRGEDHEPEPHIIPNVLSAAAKDLPFVSIFGGDYPTNDGTAVRDYIHVRDLAAAHFLALQYLRAGGASERINLGNGRGFSVREVVETAERVTDSPIEARVEPRRAGDPSHLVADAAKARLVLGWQPEFPDLETIIRTAWEWRQRNRRNGKH